MIVDDMFGTRDLVAMQWRYFPAVTGAQGELSGIQVVRVDPATGLVTHIWEMGDDLAELVGVPVMMPERVAVLV